MNYRTLASSVAAAVVAAVALGAGPAAGQNPEGRRPRTTDAATPTAPATPYSPPRTPDGQPNISGYYDPDAPSATHSLEEGEEPDNALGRSRRTLAQIQETLKHRRIMLVDPDPGPKIPYQAWAREKRRQILTDIAAPTKLTDIEPEDRCVPQGVPRINYREEFQIVQTPGLVTIFYEWDHLARDIPLDGRPHVDKGIKLYNGDSRGHWEGNTLVVDVTNLNDQTWFDAHASFHSDALHVVERWTVVDANTINYQATMDDPAVFTRPWSIAFPVRREKQADYELIEEACTEGNGLSVERTLGGWAGRPMEPRIDKLWAGLLIAGPFIWT